MIFANSYFFYLSGLLKIFLELFLNNQIAKKCSIRLKANKLRKMFLNLITLTVSGPTVKFVKFSHTLQLICQTIQVVV